MKTDYIIIILQLIVIALFTWFMYNVQDIVDSSVAQSFETYLELNGYNDI